MNFWLRKSFDRLSSLSFEGAWVAVPWYGGGFKGHRSEVQMSSCLGILCLDRKLTFTSSELKLSIKLF